MDGEDVTARGARATVRADVAPPLRRARHPNVRIRISHPGKKAVPALEQKVADLGMRLARQNLGTVLRTIQGGGAVELVVATSDAQATAAAVLPIVTELGIANRTTVRTA